MKTIEEIAIAELAEIGKDPKSLLEFSSMTEEDLIRLHHGYGTHIRNKYGLWLNSPLTEQWRTDESSRKIDGCVDCSPDHPDQVSMVIIETMWKKLQIPTSERLQ